MALEAQARSVDEQLHLQHKQMEQRLESVEPALRGAFLQAQAEHRRLTAEELPKALREENAPVEMKGRICPFSLKPETEANPPPSGGKWKQRPQTKKRQAVI